MSKPASTPFLDTAFAIGARLCRDAFWDGRRCNWLGPSMEPIRGEWKVVHKAFGPELYAGTSGIALFLARIYRLTGEPVLARTAEAAARQALSRVEDLHASVRLGFYNGHTGIAYACAELGEALGDGRWNREAFRLLRGLGEASLEEHVLDVVNGMAGAIPALIDLGSRLDDESALDLAVRLGDHLLARARRREEGWSWRETHVDESMTLIDDLLGFSHGAGGIAWALLELHRATSEERFLAAAREGFRYESHWYNAAHENWPDLRRFGPATGAPTEDSPAYSVQWCHGAPGIGLSRLRAWELLGEEVYRAEAEAALRTTCRGLFMADALATNYSLCHGRAGNAELCLEAARILGQPAWRSAAEQVGWQGIQAFERQGLPWPGGVQGAGETPNLMLGTAGTGYFYLRLHDPEATPSILILASGGREAAVRTLPRVA